MSRDNHVTFTGNIAQPELRYTPQGKSVVSFGLALNERIRVGDSWEDGDPSWVTVVAWEGLADNVAETLNKGDRVTVRGRYKNRRWENDKGEARYSQEVIADDVAVSLRWAAADIRRNARGGGHQPPIEAYGEGPAPASSATASAPGPSSYQYDEEPF